jgi:hypothetical protein
LLTAAAATSGQAAPPQLHREERGLTNAKAERRLAARGRPARARSSRAYLTITGASEPITRAVGGFALAAPSPAIVLTALAGAAVAIAGLAALDDQFIPGRTTGTPALEGGDE